MDAKHVGVSNSTTFVRASFQVDSLRHKHSAYLLGSAAWSQSLRKEPEVTGTSLYDWSLKIAAMWPEVGLGSGGLVDLWLAQGNFNVAQIYPSIKYSIRQWEYSRTRDRFQSGGISIGVRFGARANTLRKF